jgi:two-component system response regulator MprA
MGEPSTRGRILVADDDEAVRISVAEVLREEGFDVTLASDGAQALASMESEPPKLVLLDLMMPHTSGWDVLEAMHRKPELEGIEVIVLTAFGASMGLPHHCRVLHKPFERDVLVGMLPSG